MLMADEKDKNHFYHLQWAVCQTLIMIFGKSFVKNRLSQMVITVFLMGWILSVKSGSVMLISESKIC